MIVRHLDLFVLLVPVALSLSSGEVTLPYGVVTGNTHSVGCEFLGIPFAAKPERFEPPKPWTANFTNGRLSATKFTPMCPQQLGQTPPSPMSEDCLHLNVFVPYRTDEAELLPVMAWIHGGGLTTGSAMAAFYNGSRFAAEQRVVVVAMNYRLNALGFAPVARADGSVVANNGFKDQQEALRWIQRHIEAFGGNSSHVTIFGESAGGASVAVQLVSPLSAGLFHTAIIESGTVTATWPVSEALDKTAVLASSMRCSDPAYLSCLKAVNVTTLVATYSKIRQNTTTFFSAVVDGDLLPDTPVALVERGSPHRVPIILGTNMHEGSYFLGIGPLTAEKVTCAARKATNAHTAAEVLDLYPTTVGADNRGAVVSILTDAMFACPAQKLASAIAASGQKTWVYEFKRHPSCGGLPDFHPTKLGAAHSYEIPYVLDNIADNNAHQNSMPNTTACRLAPEDISLAKTVSSLWGSFARNRMAVAAWPIFEPPRQEVAKLDIGAAVNAIDTDSGYRRRQCQALEQLGFGWDDAIALMTALNAC